jgi:hypothetical protein
MLDRQQIHTHLTGAKMSNIIDLIFEKNFTVVREMLEQKVAAIMEKKLLEMKKITSAKMVAEVTMNSPNTVSYAKNMAQKSEYKPFAARRGGKAVADPEPRRPNADPNMFRSNTPNVQQKDLKGSQDPKKQPFMKDGVINRYKSQDVPLEEETLDEARIEIVKARIRGGKVQRRKKVSNVPGMTIRGGKLTRMSPAERRRRKMGAKRGKIKRKAKRSQTLMKRKRSMTRRKAMGL